MIQIFPYPKGKPAHKNGIIVYRKGKPAHKNGIIVYRKGKPAHKNGIIVYRKGKPALHFQYEKIRREVYPEVYFEVNPQAKIASICCSLLYLLSWSNYVYPTKTKLTKLCLEYN